MTIRQAIQTLIIAQVLFFGIGYSEETLAPDAAAPVAPPVCDAIKASANQPEPTPEPVFDDEISAESESPLSIHGYGGTSFGYVSNYEYEQAKNQGDWDNAYFALNLSYRTPDNLTMYIQTSLKSDDQDYDMALDYAFIDQRFSDAFQLRAGKLKTPFGLYTEIIDVGTLRPFVNLPVSVYGSWGWVTKSFYGVSGAGIVPLSNDWSLNYNVWGGQLEKFAYYDNWDNGLGLIEEYYIEDILKECFGVQLIFEAPSLGLKLGIAGYTGNDDSYYTAIEQDLDGDGNIDVIYPRTLDAANQRVSLVDAFIEYTDGDKVTVRAEFLKIITTEYYSVPGYDYLEQGWYIEASYRLTEHWQVAGGYTDYIAEYDDTGKYIHREFIVGFNYWFDANTVIKASYHNIFGHGYVFPSAEQHQAIIDAGESIKNKHHAVFTGVQFSF